MMQWPKAPGNVAMPSLRAKGSWESPHCSSTSASLQGDASWNDTDGNHTPLLRPVSLSHAEAASKGWCRRWAPRADCAQSLTVTESLFGYYHWSLGSTRAAQLLFVCLQHCAITGDFLCSSSFSSDALRCHCLDLTCLWCWSFGCVSPGAGWSVSPLLFLLCTSEVPHHECDLFLVLLLGLDVCADLDWSALASPPLALLCTCGLVLPVLGPLVVLCFW